MLSTCSFYNTSSSKQRKIQNRSFSLWKEFPTQQKAFDYVDRNGTKNDLTIFSFEYSAQNPGLRRFLVSSSKTDFYYEYLDIDSKQRHFYEMIREGAPCNLYFDLEYASEYNPDLADNENAGGYEMLARFKEDVMKKLRNDFALPSNNNIKIIHLTSNSSSKFSHHLLFRIDGWMFKNNQECGLFAQELLKKCGCNYLVFNKPKSKEETSFCDMSVYSKNRNFRVLLSSKIGKEAIFTYANQETKISLQTFLDSLVCYFDGGKSSPRLLPAKRTMPQESKLSTSTTLKKHYPRAIFDCPYPEIEHYLLSFIASLSSSTPRISSYIEYKDSSTIVYTITGSRFCDIVKREHSSNGQFYIVDLKKMTAVQKCFDPDCKGYSSAPISLPTHLFSDFQVQQGGKCEILNDSSVDLFADIPDECLLEINLSV